jgi:hypothetical protein
MGGLEGGRERSGEREDAKRRSEVGLTLFRPPLLSLHHFMHCSSAQPTWRLSSFHRNYSRPPSTSLPSRTDRVTAGGR